MTCPSSCQDLLRRHGKPDAEDLVPSSSVQMSLLTVTLLLTSLVISVIAVSLSYYTFRRNLRAAVRPVIAISMKTDFLWQLENVGRGPAINLVVGHIGERREWQDITNCYPLSPAASLSLPWIRHAVEIAAVYTDVYGGAFTSRCRANSNTVVERNDFPSWHPAWDQWLQQILAEGRDESTLREEHLHGLTPFELDLKRNEIYAKRGYRFRRKDLADHFKRQSWYAPVTDDQKIVYQKISAAEKYEAHLILRYQIEHGLKINRDE